MRLVLRYCRSICLEGPSNGKGSLDMRFRVPNSGLRRPDYEVELLHTRPQHSVGVLFLGYSTVLN